jgi:hypothetical protein
LFNNFNLGGIILLGYNITCSTGFLNSGINSILLSSSFQIWYFLNSSNDLRSFDDRVNNISLACPLKAKGPQGILIVRSNELFK